MASPVFETIAGCLIGVAEGQRSGRGGLVLIQGFTGAEVFEFQFARMFEEDRAWKQPSAGKTSLMPHPFREMPGHHPEAVSLKAANLGQKTENR